MRMKLRYPPLWKEERSFNAFLRIIFNKTKMKKTVIFAVIVAVSFLAVGCNKKQAQKPGAENNEQQKNESMTKDANSQMEYLGEQIKDAITKGEKLECVYSTSDSEGEQSVKMYMSGEKYKSVVTADGEEFNSLFDGEAQYSWPSTEKEGIKMSAECVEEFGVEDESMENMDDYEDFDNFRTTDEVLEQDLEMTCNKISEIDFSVPSDVKFVDQCEMVKNQMQQMQQLQDSLPEGMMEQMQQMQQ